jgi:hypothetical protein
VARVEQSVRGIVVSGCQHAITQNAPRSDFERR